VFQNHDVVTSNSGVVAPNGGTGPVNSKSAKAPDKVISDAEARYWASLDAESARRAKELGISQNNGSDNSDPKLCNIYYFHTDQVGLPEELSNSRGQLVWKASYKTWGSAVAESWDITDLKGDRVFESERGDIPTGEQRQQNLRFQGQYLDRDTGLHYNTFRYYDPDIGRFISPDPIGLEGGINLSVYSPNPISWIDPWGLVKKLDPRCIPGTATGIGKPVQPGNWLRETHTTGGVFPDFIANQMRGKTFRSFDHFREEFWKLVAQDPILRDEFIPQSIGRMKKGFAPGVIKSQRLGGQISYHLHHIIPINKGGEFMIWIIFL
jgi:RHS repeat-associated protein